ncbi:hypothetical protein QQS21_005065 [Conoideocrella luteorostrata]|uniref:Mcm2 3 5 family protein n=1 Tax=Conoideocrella luteorostrata TaxID=1105319 RepID=A0AAJ0CQB3_9HYPO|nr:hypothetical protein QQS21_005065 [Conoideocrella luteorostrata]
MDHQPGGLHPVKEIDEDHTSTLSLDSLLPKKTSLRGAFNSGGYERVNLDDGDDITANAESNHNQSQSHNGSPSPADSLGIYPKKRDSIISIPRVPVAAKSPRISSPITSASSTPKSCDSLLDSPASSNGRSPRTRRVWDTPPRFSSLFDRLRMRDGDGEKTETNNQSAAPTSAANLPGDGIPQSKGHGASLSLETDAELAGDMFDDDAFNSKFGKPPSYCSSKNEIYKRRNSYIAVVVFVLSVYSTTMSGLWLIVSIVQPRWNHAISSKGNLLPSTATLLTALLAKTIEISFVTVFISCIGQVLTRRSFVRKAKGMTLAEITMRNWVIQPGSLITHFETLPYAAGTVLGALTLTATVSAMFYTTASDAMVAPKLQFGGWTSRDLHGVVMSSYANVQFIKSNCPNMLGTMPAVQDDGDACLSVQFSGQSYRNLLSFMSTWADVRQNGTNSTELADRPKGRHSLYDNTTMTAAWIETGYSNVTINHQQHGRIINNVTMAMPHPGVYAAAVLPKNEILQPDDLAGVGEYAIRAGVVSPTINVMCVNMNRDELAPLVYTAWENSRKSKTEVGDQLTGPSNWENDVPIKREDEYLNRTVVDNIFQWGPVYKRRPPVFSLYPADYNMVANSTVIDSDSIYILAKSSAMTNYTVCQMRSWVSPKCSTNFNISGTGGVNMEAHCEDPKDENAYYRSWEPGQGWPAPEKDWKWVGDIWRLSMDINGGFKNSNASNARILTKLALKEPKLDPFLPSMAEALAVYGGSTLVMSSLKTPLQHYWDRPDHVLNSEDFPKFNASVITQQYTSGHVLAWQKIFYVVLVLVFVINLCCLVYSGVRHGLVTDFTEPQNLFALAINSPPSAQLKGSCGGGPEKRDLVVPWRVAYAPSANHYFFEEANEKPWRGKYSRNSLRSSSTAVSEKGSSYKRLSSGRGWL